MRRDRRRLQTKRGSRRLQVEMLERREMLAGPDGWLPTLVVDGDGDLFTVGLDHGPIYSLGRMDQVIRDLAFSPSGQLYGVAGEQQSELFLIDLDLADPGEVIRTTSLGQIVTPGGRPVEINSLGFRDDGGLFAAGIDADGEGIIVQIDADTLQTTYVWAPSYQPAGDIAFLGSRGPFITGDDGKLHEIVISDVLESYAQTVADLGFDDFEGLTGGLGTTLVAYRGGGEIYQIEVETGEVDFVGLVAQDEFDTLHGATEFQHDRVDLGVVDYVELPDQTSATGELWYQVEALRDGYLSAHGFSQQSCGGDVCIQGFTVTQLRLYELDDSGPLVELASGGGGVTYEQAIAGRSYILRITGASREISVEISNQVRVDREAGEVKVFGSGAHDEVRFTGGKKSISYFESANMVVVNGFSYPFDASEIRTISIGEIEEVQLNGSEGEEIFGMTRSRDPRMGFDIGNGLSLQGVSAVMRGDWGTVTVAISNSIKAFGHGGHDQAVFIDHRGVSMVANHVGYRESETFVASPGQARMTGSDYAYEAVGFETVRASFDGAPQTNDVAELSGSSEADRVVSTPDEVTLSGEGYSISVSSADRVVVYGSAGFDTAQLHGANRDIEGRFVIPDDTLVATPDTVTLSSTGRAFDGKSFLGKQPRRPVQIEIVSFEEVRASVSGENDSARFADSIGDDVYVVTPTEATMNYGTGGIVEAEGFRYAHAYSTHDGTDVARFYDSQGDDRFEGDPNVGKMIYADGSIVRAKFFDYVHAYAKAGGDDSAVLFDSPKKDVLIATPTYARMRGDGFNNRVKYFDEVWAHATFRGGDKARLFGADGDDRFVGGPRSSDLSGPGYSVFARDFATVVAYAGAQGHDVATLRDSSGNDTLRSRPHKSVIWGLEAGYEVTVRWFDEVYAQASDGDDDFASLLDTPDDDHLVAAGSSVSLSTGFGGLDLLYRIIGFDRVQANRTSGNDSTDTADVTPPLSFDLELIGGWR